VQSNVIVFPFELFGNGGTGAGAQLLADAVREILDDTQEETRPCRADCLRDTVRVHEFAFETPQQVADWRKTGRQIARRHLKAGNFLLWLGGNHLSVLPVLEELGPTTLVVQFDAHLDMYAFHDTTSELSHGNYLRHFKTRRPRLVNIGHRDLFIPPTEIATIFEATFSAVDVALRPDAVASAVRTLAAGASQVWIDLDSDVFDPAAMPAVQQPLPFGLAPPVFLKLMAAAWAGNVRGLSISEFSPGHDQRDTGLNLLGWLLEFVLLHVHGDGTTRSIDLAR
jgi:arginase family enzyme